MSEEHYPIVKKTKISFKRASSNAKAQKRWKAANKDKVRNSKKRNYDKGNKPKTLRRWEPEEDKLVLLHLCTDIELSNMINRSVRAIQVRRNRLRGEENGSVQDCGQGEVQPTGGQDLLRQSDGGGERDEASPGIRTLPGVRDGGGLLPGPDQGAVRFTLSSGYLNNGFEWAIEVAGDLVYICFATEAEPEVYVKSFKAWGESAEATAMICAQKYDAQHIYNHRNLIVQPGFGFFLMEPEI